MRKNGGYIYQIRIKEMDRFYFSSPSLRLIRKYNEQVLGKLE